MALRDISTYDRKSDYILTAFFDLLQNPANSVQFGPCKENIVQQPGYHYYRYKERDRIIDDYDFTHIYGRISRLYPNVHLYKLAGPVEYTTTDVQHSAEPSPYHSIESQTYRIVKLSILTRSSSQIIPVGSNGSRRYCPRWTAPALILNWIEHTRPFRLRIELSWQILWIVFVCKPFRSHSHNCRFRLESAQSV